MLIFLHADMMRSFHFCDVKNSSFITLDDESRDSLQKFSEIKKCGKSF